MSIARRNFLKSVTMSTLSAGIALGSAHLVLGQRLTDVEDRFTDEGTQQPIQTTQVSADGYFPVPLQAQLDPLFSFRASTFRPYVGDIFQAPNSRGELIELKLIRVAAYKMKGSTRISTRKAQQPQAFSLTFSATEHLPPFTSIHKMGHPALGEFDLFLTSHKTEDETFLLAAVFNHLQVSNSEY